MRVTNLLSSAVKCLQLQGAPDQGLCPWTLLGAPPSDPHIGAGAFLAFPFFFLQETNPAKHRRQNSLTIYTKEFTELWWVASLSHRAAQMIRFFWHMTKLITETEKLQVLVVCNKTGRRLKTQARSYGQCCCLWYPPDTHAWCRSWASHLCSAEIRKKFRTNLKDSPPRFFIPGLKPPLYANHSHCSLPFLLQDWLDGFPRLFICFLLFSFALFHFLVFGSVWKIKLTCVSFWAHFTIASHIISKVRSK